MWCQGITMVGSRGESVVTHGTDEQTDTSKNRLVVVGVLWLVGVPVFIGLWLLMGWWVLVLVVAALWATLRYVRRDARKRPSHRHGDDGKGGVPSSDYGMGSRAEDALREDTDPPSVGGFM
jgi:hypothetical protein